MHNNNEPNKYITCFIFIFILLFFFFALVTRPIFNVHRYSWSLNTVQSEKINVFRVVVAKAIEMHTKNIYIWMSESLPLQLELKFNGNKLVSSELVCANTHWTLKSCLDWCMWFRKSLVLANARNHKPFIKQYESYSLLTPSLALQCLFIGIVMHSIRKLLIFVDLMPFRWVRN